MVIWNLIIHCERIPPTSYFIHQLILLSLFFLFEWESLSSTFLANFSCTNTMLSTTVTMLYIRSSGLIHLIAESLHRFTNLSRLSHSVPPGSQFSTLCFYEFDFLKKNHSISEWYLAVFVFLCLTFHLA